MTKHQAIPRRPRLLSRGDGLSYQPTTFGLTQRTVQEIKVAAAEASLSTSALVEIILTEAIASGDWEKLVNKYVKNQVNSTDTQTGDTAKDDSAAD